MKHRMCMEHDFIMIPTLCSRLLGQSDVMICRGLVYRLTELHYIGS